MHKLIQALLKTGPWPHPVSEVQLRETHISWVLLTGSYAYKIKKPVNFGFLDFSTLERRHRLCDMEVQLNRRLAPQLYLDAVPICGTPERPVVSGEGNAIEWAVRMHQFDERQLLSTLASEHRLTTAHVDAIADVVANFHRHLPPSDKDQPWGKPERVQHWVRENFDHILPKVADSIHVIRIRELQQACERLSVSTGSAIEARRAQGFVRECHGDLHLGNMAWLECSLVPFDCIEFNPELRWIDVMSEVAFVFMDLEDRGYPHFNWRFLNRYLSITGDYAGLRVLRYYLVYRALVRAKVVLLRRAEEAEGDPERDLLWAEFAGYADLAERELIMHRPALILTHGLSGSGKSTFATQLAEKLGLLHIRSDVERKRLFGLNANARTEAGISEGIYSPDAFERTYDCLLEIGNIALAAGYPVLVDATFLQRAHRESFKALAQRNRCGFLLLDFQAPQRLLETRVKRRQLRGGDPSEAGVSVLQRQLAEHEPLTEEERENSLRIDTGNEVWKPQLAGDLVPLIKQWMVEVQAT